MTGDRSVTCGKLCTEGRQIFGTIIQNFITQVTQQLGFVQPCYKIACYIQEDCNPIFTTVQPSNQQLYFKYTTSICYSHILSNYNNTETLNCVFMMNISTSSRYDEKKLQKQCLKYSETRGTEDSVVWVMKNSCYKLTPNFSDFSSLAKSTMLCQYDTSHFHFVQSIKLQLTTDWRVTISYLQGIVRFLLIRNSPDPANVTKEFSVLCI